MEVPKQVGGLAPQTGAFARVTGTKAGRDGRVGLGAGVIWAEVDGRLEALKVPRYLEAPGEPLEAPGGPWRALEALEAPARRPGA